MISRASNLVEVLARVIGLLLVTLSLSVCTNSPIGMTNAKPLTWEYIQAVGGVRLGDPYFKEGTRWVPLIIDLSGTQTITVVPTLSNTGLICSAVTVAGGGNQVTGTDIWISVYADPKQQSGMGQKSSQCGDFPLATQFGGIGTHRVFYKEKSINLSIFESREYLIGTLE